MTAWRTLEQTSQEAELVVAFFDLTGFQKMVRAWSGQELIDFMGDYYEYVGELVASYHGRLVKFMGDAGLITFLPEDADKAVQFILALQAEGDRWLAERRIKSHHLIKGHFGSMVCGMFGAKDNKQFDILGDNVNLAVTLPSNGIAITPQLFRQLSPEMRQAFKKHTPPITYIPVHEPHG